MKITGSMNYVRFDLGNGYVIKAEREMLVGRKFVAYTDTMKAWESPHENEKISQLRQYKKTAMHVLEVTHNSWGNLDKDVKRNKVKKELVRQGCLKI